MSAKFDYVVFIGRFQPFHDGHLGVIRTALEYGNEVIIAIGSSNQARTPKNPWTFAERREAIFRSMPDDVKPRIHFVALSDRPYNDQQWAAGVQQGVHAVMSRSGWVDRAKVALIGHKKDDTSFYLDMFPQWSLIEHELNDEINATDLRELYFEGRNLKYLRSLVPPTTYEYLEWWRTTKHFASMQKEYQHIQSYKKAWAAAPYPVVFCTVDAVVIQSGHVLLVRRKSSPGENLLALPGGFVDQHERLIDGAVRELREETKLKVPAPVLKGSLKTTKVYDAPGRSLRGRTITHAFLFELAAGKLPAVKGGDDAKKAMWVPICDLQEDQFFEDHYSIIVDLLGL